MPSQRTNRILLAKIGLDGHDRGVKVLAREFRDAGMEVIYTGLWQTPRATVQAAMQEDVDVLGVSLHSAAHMTIMAEVIRWRDRYGIGPIPAVLGGIVPENDYAALKEMGVAAVFNPGSSMESILNECRRLSAERARASFEEALGEFRAGRVTGLAQLLSYLQQSVPPGEWKPGPGRAVVVGVTGSAGVGKSSFIGKLARKLRVAGKRVAAVAVDPTSHLSGGALLGDRLRMMDPEPDEEFFVRSLSSGGLHGGLGRGCRPVVEALGEFGFDYILVETVGAGQTDVDVAELTDHVLVLLMPQAGDEIQFAKAGMMEIASGLVLNKADLPGVERTRADLTAAVGKDKPIWSVSTLKSEGIDPVAEWVLGL